MRKETLTPKKEKNSAKKRRTDIQMHVDRKTEEYGLRKWRGERQLQIFHKKMVNKTGEVRGNWGGGYSWAKDGSKPETQNEPEQVRR